MIFNDTTFSTIEWALSAESERQRISAHNLANVNTPGFRSRRLDFETSLARALRAPGGTAIATTRGARTPLNLNDNDVSLEHETQIITKSNIHYESLVQALNFKLSALRSAIGR